MSAVPVSRRLRLPVGVAMHRLSAADPVLTIAVVVGVLIVAAAILAPVIAPYPYAQTDILHASKSPSSAHLFGTDSLGRDIFSRVLNAARLSLLAPAAITLLAMLLGVGMAIGSVWIGGRVDRLVSRALDILFAFPSLLIAILAVSIFGVGVVAPIFALSIAYTPYIARVVRSVALRERNLAYIDSCRLMGYSGWRICGRHILPNVRGIVAAQATVAFASALVDLAALSFIGLGTQPPTVDWGRMVSDGSAELLNNAPEQSLAAGAAIVLTVVVFNVLGERLSVRAARATK
jgi:peptide/nickel transport system permease protein